MDGQASGQLLGDVGPVSSCPVAGMTDLSQEVAGAKETPVVLKHGDAPARVLTAMELEEIGALRAAAKRRLLSFHVSKVFKVAEDIGFVRSVPTSVLWTSNSKNSRIRIARMPSENEIDSSSGDDGPATVLHTVLQLGGSDAKASCGSSGAETDEIHGGGPITPSERLPVPFITPKRSGHTPAAVTPTPSQVTIGIYVHVASGARGPEVSVMPVAPAASTLVGCTPTGDMLSASASPV